MTKGGRHSFGSSSFHERFLRSYNSYVQDQSEGGEDDLAELGEEEVWSVAPEHEHHYSSEVTMTQYQLGAQSRFSSSQLPAAWPAKVRRQPAVGGLSLAFAGAGNSPQIIHQPRVHDGGKKSGSVTGSLTAGSAPVDVPSWPAMMRTESTELLREDYDSAEEVNGGERIPPHEYLSRSRRTAAMSVFEGVGRTLKGRDMSRVRDAVWNQTGFFG